MSRATAVLLLSEDSRGNREVHIATSLLCET